MKIKQITAFVMGLLLMGGVASHADTMVTPPDGFGKRPLTMIVPFGSGGGSDQLARAMAKAMGEVAGLDFQVVNKPGGGGTSAIPDFMLAPADGYTALTKHTQHLSLIHI